MTKTRTALTLAALMTMGTGIATTAQAQNQRGGMPSMLREGSPQIGETIPDVMIYDNQGNPISIHSLKGKYKVIVFGCLT